MVIVNYAKRVILALTLAGLVYLKMYLYMIDFPIGIIEYWGEYFEFNEFYDNNLTYIQHYDGLLYNDNDLMT